MDIDGGAHELHCLRCGQALRFEQLGGIAASDADRAFFDCSNCGARNEIRSEPQPGLGEQPGPVVLRVVPDRR